MAVQYNDRIYLDGELFELISTPLSTFFEAHPEIPRFRGKISECRRGYIATWRIRNNVLFLTGFQQASPTTVINPRDVLTGPKIVADWYDGILRIPLSSDKPIETELHIRVQNGVVYNHEIVQKQYVTSNSSKKNNVL